jgi:hypothetical protein
MLISFRELRELQKLKEPFAVVPLVLLVPSTPPVPFSKQEIDLRG